MTSSQAKWNKANPDKIRAHRIVRKALARGIIEREPCAWCGDPNSEMHHPRYDEPLFIFNFCRRHHQQLHAKLRKLECEGVSDA